MLHHITSIKSLKPFSAIILDPFTPVMCEDAQSTQFKSCIFQCNLYLPHLYRMSNYHRRSPFRWTEKLQNREPMYFKFTCDGGLSAYLRAGSKSLYKHFRRTHKKILEVSFIIIDGTTFGSDAWFWLHVDTTKALAKHKYHKLFFTAFL